MTFTENRELLRYTLPGSKYPRIDIDLTSIRREKGICYLCNFIIAVSTTYSDDKIGIMET